MMSESGGLAGAKAEAKTYTVKDLYVHITLCLCRLYTNKGKGKERIWDEPPKDWPENELGVWRNPTGKWKVKLEDLKKWCNYILPRIPLENRTDCDRIKSMIEIAESGRKEDFNFFMICTHLHENYHNTIKSLLAHKEKVNGSAHLPVLEEMKKQTLSELNHMITILNENSFVSESMNENKKRAIDPEDVSVSCKKSRSSKEHSFNSSPKEIAKRDCPILPKPSKQITQSPVSCISVSAQEPLQTFLPPQSPCTSTQPYTPILNPLQFTSKYQGYNMSTKNLSCIGNIQEQNSTIISSQSFTSPIDNLATRKQTPTFNFTNPIQDKVDIESKGSPTLDENAYINLLKSPISLETNPLDSDEDGRVRLDMRIHSVDSGIHSPTQEGGFELRPRGSVDFDGSYGNEEIHIPVSSFNGGAIEPTTLTSDDSLQIPNDPIICGNARSVDGEADFGFVDSENFNNLLLESNWDLKNESSNLDLDEFLQLKEDAIAIDFCSVPSEVANDSVMERNTVLAHLEDSSSKYTFDDVLNFEAKSF